MIAENDRLPINIELTAPANERYQHSQPALDQIFTRPIDEIWLVDEKFDPREGSSGVD